MGSVEDTSLLLDSARGDELDVLAADPDPELITRLLAQLGGARLADEQIPVSMKWV